MSNMVPKTLTAVVIIGSCLILSSCDLNMTLKGKVVDGYYFDGDNQAKFKIPQGGIVVEDWDKYLIDGRRPLARQVNIHPVGKSDRKLSSFFAIIIFYKKVNLTGNDLIGLYNKYLDNEIFNCSYGGKEVKVLHRNIIEKPTNGSEGNIILKVGRDEPYIEYARCNYKNGFWIQIICTVSENKFERQNFVKICDDIVSSFETIR